MGDPTKFNNIYEYYIFNLFVLFLVLLEIFIFLYSFQKNKVNMTNKDKGTKWLLYINFVFCITISFYTVSQKVPLQIRKILFPSIVIPIGIILIFIGIIIRLVAVLSLNKSFILNIQTTSEQHLITTGIYHTIRHPAYTGSIVSLLGLSLSMRNIISVVLTIVCCLFCYNIRIKVEEKVLQVCFKEYSEYKNHTYKLFPHFFKK